jgi:hypothetical protein
MTAANSLFSTIPSPPPMLDRAAVEQARLVRLERDRIASTEPSFDYDALARARQSTVLAARQWVKRQRARNSLFVVDYDGGTLIPSFQFDEACEVNPDSAAIVEQLIAFSMSGWAMWQWFTSSNPWIESRPVDVLGAPLAQEAVDGLVDD